ncbi:MAG: transposase, partial [Verrucomicrobiota bacterium]
LREHFQDGAPISEVCQKHQLQPSLFYNWQKIFFENGTAAFERQPSLSRVGLEEKRITQLEVKLQRKDEVMAELLTEHILLKKVLGRPEAPVGRT